MEMEIGVEMEIDYTQHKVINIYYLYISWVVMNLLRSINN